MDQDDIERFAMNIWASEQSGPHVPEPEKPHSVKPFKCRPWARIFQSWPFFHSRTSETAAPVPMSRRAPALPPSTHIPVLQDVGVKRVSGSAQAPVERPIDVTAEYRALVRRKR